MVIYIAGSIPLFRGKRSNHFRLQRQSKHGALCRLKGQAAAPFPDKSSSRFAASVFIGKTLYPTAPCKRAFENGNDRPATHRPEGKNKVGLYGEADGRDSHRRKADGRHAAGYLRGKYRSLLGNFPSRIASNAENSPIRQGESPSAHPIGDGICRPRRYKKSLFHKPKKKGRIYGFRGFTHGKGARQRQRNNRTYRAFHHTEERRPHTHASEPQAHRISRRGERPFGGCSKKTGRSGADTQNRKQPSTGNPHQRVGNARGHEADRGRGAFGRVVRRQSEILRRHIRKGEHRGGSPAQGRGNAAHTRYARSHRQGRAKAQKKGGTDERSRTQERGIKAYSSCGEALRMVSVGERSPAG